MNRNLFNDLETSDLQTVDLICAEFEKVYGSERSLIERFLADAPERIRIVLFGELLAFELEMRGRGGALPDQADYLARFPDQSEQIRLVFERILSDQAESNQRQQTRTESQIEVDPQPEMPDAIGRFRVEKVLGHGGFGIVYKAYDDRLARAVAIKVPLTRFSSRPNSTGNHLAEARSVAQLEHPHIVPVYELGSDDEFPLFIVSRYVDGTSLAQKINPKQVSDPLAVAELIATIAEALQHAHEQGLVHRDVKPGNILIDRQGQPHLADFGLVLREEDVGNDSGYAGTPAYMSPEQAAGEGHLVDGRSDIFSLGIVFYELLVGRRPFGGDNKQKVMRNVVTSRPRPLRQFAGELPPELERICLKALSKRISRRYSTARDMANDLRDFLALSSSVRTAPDSTTLLDSATSDSSDSQWSASSSANESATAVIPRGLRSFDSRDKDFFLQLLPGPRNRDGLPESVWFWKTQIEETDRHKTFSVGLIYGPSGCGKSSLVKAGLLPQLSDDVTTIYIEATGMGTEEALRQQLKMRFGELTEDLDPGQSMAAIRRRPMMSGHKLLILIDQFEQWLHVQQGTENGGLLAVLRQCDGQHIQCILMVRDDFWLSISRLMLELDVDLIPGHNVALIDLFDEDHARNVLAAFGRAFGKLPEKPSDMSKAQVDFLDRVIGGLSQDGKVVCVRLALFAEMLKSKPWVPETLERIGGTEGVGVAFLNDTFDSPGSNPAYRAHREAAQRVLKALLPETGSDIKGKMQSSEELLKISGYQDQPQHFENLIRILDSDLRLITPTETAESNDGDDQSTTNRSRYFLLTHDYLVHVVRDWITQSQRETRRGRAELRLEDRTREWQSRRTNRYLPTMWGYANIRLFTRKPQWNATQRQMMRKARNFHAVRWGSGLLAVLLVAFSVQSLLRSSDLRHQSEQAEIAVANLSSSRGATTPRAIDDLAQFPREIVIQKLRARRENAGPDEDLVLSYALAAYDGLKAPQELVEQVSFTPAGEVANLTQALRHSKKVSLPALRKAFDSFGNDARLQMPRSLSIFDLREAFDARNQGRHHSLRNLTELREVFDSHGNEAGLAKARFAILAMYLGDLTPAKLMCRRVPDPILRTLFIEQYANWHGRISELAEVAKSVDDPDLQSALCMAVGSTELDPFFPGDRESWRALAANWYLNSPDSGVHSAAGWMLRHWEMPLPVIPPTSEPSVDKDWHVSPSGLTMLRIPAGEFENRMKGDWTVFSEDAPSQKITVSRDFLMCDRAVPTGNRRQQY